MKPLLKIDEVAGILETSRRSVRRFWYAGTIPAPIRVGRRGVRWRAADIEAYLANQPAIIVAGQTQEVTQ